MRDGHSEENCLKKTKDRLAVNSAITRDAEGCFRCGVRGHWFKDCPHKDEAVSHDLKDEKVRCFNCGKFGHEREHCVKKLGRKAMMRKEDRELIEKKIE